MPREPVKNKTDRLIVLNRVGRRLRAAGVGLEDRQDLLGHKSGKVTTEYSAPELANLMRHRTGSVG